VIGVPDSMAPRQYQACRLQAARLQLADYAELEVCWCQGLLGYGVLKPKAV